MGKEMKTNLEFDELDVLIEKLDEDIAFHILKENSLKDLQASEKKVGGKSNPISCDEWSCPPPIIMN